MLVGIVQTFFTVYTILILIRILGSWFPNFQQTTFMRFVAHYTDPYLNIFKKIIPPIGGTLDISPILAFFVLQILQGVIIGFLR